MNKLKIAIFDEIRKNDASLSSYTDDNLDHVIFHHRNGLRLTHMGFLSLKKIFASYIFDLPSTIKSRHQFAMSKFEYPYFFTKKKIVVFSELDATMIKLQGGIQEFLENYSKM